MLPQLPQEILIEILMRLPVKSLMRFQAVSRSWNSLIKSKSFITQQLSKSVEASDLILMRHYDHTRKQEIYTFYRGDGNCLIEDQVLEFPIKNKDYKYAGACNGLLCLFEDSNNYLNIALWNPCIMNCFHVPFPRFIGMSQTCEVGLGFDLWTNQYKVIRLIYTNGRPRRHIALEVEVFVLGTSKWRRLVSHVPFMVSYFLNTNPVYLHGAIHWTGYGPDDLVVIIVFDMHKEVFREIEVPSMNHPSNFFTVTVCGESLCLLEHDSAIGGKVGGVFIWVMKRYNMKESWTKLFRVNGEDQWRFNSVLGFRKNGKLLVFNDDKMLVSYDLSGRVEQVRIHGKHDEFLVPNGNKELPSYDRNNGKIEELGIPDYRDASPHIECLVIPKGMDGVEGQVSSCSLMGL